MTNIQKFYNIPHQFTIFLHKVLWRHLLAVPELSFMGGASSTIASGRSRGREGGPIPSVPRWCHLMATLVTCSNKEDVTVAVTNHVIQADGPVVNRPNFLGLPLAILYSSILRPCPSILWSWWYFNSFPASILNGKNAPRTVPQLQWCYSCFLGFEALLFAIFTSIMLGTQVNAIWNDETVSPVAS